MDGGGVKGIIPAVVIDYMERKAYNYSLAQSYISVNSD
jgi:hypothetical protein